MQLQDIAGEQVMGVGKAMSESVSTERIEVGAGGVGWHVAAARVGCEVDEVRACLEDGPSGMPRRPGGMFRDGACGPQACTLGSGMPNEMARTSCCLPDEVDLNASTSTLTYLRITSSSSRCSIGR